MPENLPLPAEDLEPRPQAPKTFTRVNEQGFYEVVDLHTGQILCIESKPTYNFLQKKFDDLVEIDTPQGKVWIDKHIDPERILVKKHPKYSQGWADLIAEKITQGATLLQACDDLRLNYTTICRWRREYPDFLEAIKQARQDRAEAFHDRAIQIAKKADDASVKRDKLEIETLQWSAEKMDPGTFGQKVAVENKTQSFTHIIIETGIRRNQEVPQAFKDVIESSVPKAQAIEAAGGAENVLHGTVTPEMLSPQESTELPPTPAIIGPKEGEL